METDPNTLVHQLSLPGNALPGAPVTHWITWLQQIVFGVEPNPGRLHEGPDGLPL